MSVIIQLENYPIILKKYDFVYMSWDIGLRN